MTSLLSFHDVTPAVLPTVEQVLHELVPAGGRRAALLVIPGTHWSGADIERLRALVRSGCELAGHGWQHRCNAIRGLRHRLHSALISRHVAEHLCLDPGAELALMQRCFDWFAQAGLPPPRLYVPPAWALGRVSRKALAQQPFDWVEVLSGVIDTRARRHRVLPVIGFEADTPARRVVLRLSNALNRALATVLRRPVRIAVHPADLDLRLGESLRQELQGIDRALTYADAMDRSAA
mgnify:CR=1 FL=1